MRALAAVDGRAVAGRLRGPAGALRGDVRRGGLRQGACRAGRPRSGSGFKAFRDPGLAEDFAAPRLPHRRGRVAHVRRRLGRATEAVFSVDGEEVRRCAAPAGVPAAGDGRGLRLPGVVGPATTTTWCRPLEVDRIAGRPARLHRPRSRRLGASSERMSMRQPVSRAARRAFWPSLPIASESWKSGTITRAERGLGVDHLDRWSPAPATARAPPARPGPRTSRRCRSSRRGARTSRCGPAGPSARCRRPWR